MKENTDAMGEHFVQSLSATKDTPKINLPQDLQNKFSEQIDKDLSFLMENGFSNPRFSLGLKKVEELPKKKDAPEKVKIPSMVMFCTDDKKVIKKLKKSKKDIKPISPVNNRRSSLSKVVLEEYNPPSVFHAVDDGVAVSENGSTVINYFGFLDFGTKKGKKKVNFFSTIFQINLFLTNSNQIRKEDFGDLMKLVKDIFDNV